MSDRKALLVEPGTQVRLDKIDRSGKDGHGSRESVQAPIPDQVSPIGMQDGRDAKGEQSRLAVRHLFGG